MSDQIQPAKSQVSRRDFLHLTAAGGGAVFAATIAGSARAAPKKFSQQQAHYQPVPKSGQRCQSCSLWQPPTSCEQVDGQISPAGWCILYQEKK